MQMGTQMIGVTPNPDDALYLARQFVPYDPQQVKKQEPVWMSVPQMDASKTLLDYSWPEVIDYRKVEYTPDEQLLLAAHRFTTLKRFEFLVRLATSEGNTSGTLQKLSIAKMDLGLYPSEQLLGPVRHVLAQQVGHSVQPRLAEIQPRQQGEGMQKQMKSDPPLAILNGEEELTYAAESNHLSTSPAAVISPADARNSVTTPTGDDDDFWQ
jgi:hypothetical protein